MNIKKTIEPYIEIQGGLIPALHAIQNDAGYLDIQSIKTIADGFNISTAEVIDVITYYDDFRQEKAGQFIIKVCQAESCQSLASRSLLNFLKSHFNLEVDTTAKNKSVTLKEVFCLGNCALSPSVSINDSVIGRATTDKVLLHLKDCKDNLDND